MHREPLPILTKPCQFGEFRFDPVDGQLYYLQESVRLQPRLAKLLSIFLANVDQLLTREQLSDNLWPDKVVNEDALSRCVAELRSALKDKSTTPIFIETVPKKGYRFIHPITAQKQQSKTIFVWLAVITIAMTLYWSFSSDDVTTELKVSLLNATRLTTDNQRELHPELSNNGQLLAFSQQKENRLIVRIVSTQGEHLYDIEDPTQNLYSATFARDDQSIFIAGLASGKCTIYRYQLPQLIREELISCFMPTMAGILDQSPDGKQLAYVVKDQATDSAAIWLYQIDTQQTWQFTKPSQENQFDTRPRFSANGQYLGFTRGTKSSRGIYITALAPSSQASAITDGQHYITSFDWLSDNRHIIFDSNQFGDRKLWLTNIKNKQLKLLGAKDAQFPSLDSNNSRLAYREVQFNANIWRLDLTDENPQPEKIIESIKYNNFPTFSPDGTQVAFISNRSGRGELWLYSLVTKQQQLLYKLPQHDLVLPNWSPQGNKVVVSRRGPAGYRCIEIDLHTKQQTVIDNIVENHFACVYGQDGGMFAILKTHNGNSGLIKLDRNGASHSVSQLSFSRIEITSAGDLIYSLTNKDGLFLMDNQGNNPQTLLASFSRTLDGFWTVQGDFLYYPKTRGSRGIWRRNLNSGAEQRVTSELPSTVGLSIDVNSDHSQLIYSQTDSVQADIYITHLDQPR